MTNQPETTVTVDALARMLSAADVEINHGDYPTWDTLAESGQKQYRQAARYLLKRLHITTPAAVSAAAAPPTQAALRDRAAVLREAADRMSKKASALTEDLHDLAHFVAKDRLREAEILDREAAELRRMADETATETPAVDLPTLAAALDGLHTLIATSSRDWQTYRVDAWLWAVLCGWDCEQTEHDDTCVHGELEETAAMHGWDEATVAKARRYRAAVRAVTETLPAAGARQDGTES